MVSVLSVSAVISGKYTVMEQLFNSGFHYSNYTGADSIILWKNYSIQDSNKVIMQVEIL